MALIISTTFIKNHTKKLDEEIFSIKENINYLNSVKELVQLEHDYLKFSRKIIRINLYFSIDQLKHTSRENIQIIENADQINFKILNKNE